jgi:hypothetical protein
MVSEKTYYEVNLGEGASNFCILRERKGGREEGKGGREGR